jgi:fumarate hydratase class II
MTDREFRVERDSLGEVRVPTSALYGAQTQRALDNFQISGLRFPPPLIAALALVKRCSAVANRDFGLLDASVAAAIEAAARRVETGELEAHFPIDVFQTGSGTSTNMNVNEVIARLASDTSGGTVHPNDHVNMSQSSNDVFPSAIHISAYREVTATLVPALAHLADTIQQRAAELDKVVVTGRTHLMDALPIRMGQELGAWSHQVERSIEGLRSTLPRVCELALGGTAVGTGVNTPPGFAARVVALVAADTESPFVEARNRFALLSSQDTAVELAGQLQVVAVAITKIANDLRWMSSGPVSGLAEIELPALQPGSSMMPGKVNPVIPEAVAMVCTQVIGNVGAIAVAGQTGNFQLNVMLPLIAHNLLQSVQLLARAATALADKVVTGFRVNADRVAATLERNPILATALVPLVGYDLTARIVQRALAEGRSVREVAAEMTDLDDAELARALDPHRLADGGGPPEVELH